ncbi:MAG: NUDIX domain-containing protein [Deinococcota bacterium]
MFHDNLRIFQKAAIFHPDKPAVLLIQRSQDDSFRPNQWDFPGGSVDWGEDHEQALTREIAEEVGLRVNSIRPYHVMSRFRQKRNRLTFCVVYLCQANTAEVVLSHEHSKFAWCDKTMLEAHTESSIYPPLGLEALRLRQLQVGTSPYLEGLLERF